VVWTAELAEVGWILPWTGENRARASDGMLAGPLATATWKGQLYAVPFAGNAQLLWYRRSRVAETGLDLSRPVTWEQLIAASRKLPPGQNELAVQGNRYEGYLVWINALLEGAGGHLLLDAAKGARAHSGIDSAAGRAAAQVIHDLAHSPAASPGLPTAVEESTRAEFENGSAAFMVNWPYVFATAKVKAERDPSFRATFADYGWARYPRTVADLPSHPPLGGINLAVGAFTPGPKRALAFEAALCMTSLPNLTYYMATSGTAAARAAVFQEPEIQRLFPFAQLLKESIDEAGPRPLTPFYNALSISVQRTFHPPRAVDPKTTPQAADALVEKALAGKVLL
jgi:multiple sugar transport system substrate-binding protein